MSKTDKALLYIFLIALGFLIGEIFSARYLQIPYQPSVKKEIDRLETEKVYWKSLTERYSNWLYDCEEILRDDCGATEECED